MYETAFTDLSIQCERELAADSADPSPSETYPKRKLHQRFRQLSTTHNGFAQLMWCSLTPVGRSRVVCRLSHLRSAIELRNKSNTRASDFEKCALSNLDTGTDAKNYCHTFQLTNEELK